MTQTQRVIPLAKSAADIDRLYRQWEVDAPWQSTGILEPLNVWTGKFLYRRALRSESRLYGFSEHHHRIDGFDLYWLSNKKPKNCRGTLLLLHGLSAEKSHWIRFARYFTKHYHIIIPDLPAHGKTGCSWLGRVYSSLGKKLAG